MTSVSPGSEALPYRTVYEGLAVNIITHRRRKVRLTESGAVHATLVGLCTCAGPCACSITPEEYCPEGWPSKLSALGVV